jgi:hypothetical protein
LGNVSGMPEALAGGCPESKNYPEIASVPEIRGRPPLPTLPSLIAAQPQSPRDKATACPTLLRLHPRHASLSIGTFTADPTQETDP